VIDRVLNALRHHCLLHPGGNRRRRRRHPVLNALRHHCLLHGKRLDVGVAIVLVLKRLAASLLAAHDRTLPSVISHTWLNALAASLLAARLTDALAGPAAVCSNALRHPLLAAQHEGGGVDG